MIDSGLRTNSSCIVGVWQTQLRKDDHDLVGLSVTHRWTEGFYDLHSAFSYLISVPLRFIFMDLSPEFISLAKLF